MLNKFILLVLTQKLLIPKVTNTKITENK